MTKYVPSSVHLIDKMGTDLSVVNAARVSFDKIAHPLHHEVDLQEYISTVTQNREKKGLAPLSEDPRFGPWNEYAFDHVSVGYPAINFTDYKLIDFLAREDHFTPFGHAVVTFKIKAPIFVARQLVKHQIGLCWNEVSRRYVDTPPDFYRVKWLGRPDKSIKQGSSTQQITLKPTPYDAVPMDDPLGHVTIQLTPEGLTDMAFQLYIDLLEQGVSPEKARTVLPLNHMTEWVWTGSLLAWARVCNLRLDPHAQQETQEVAAGIAVEMNRLFPVSWEALTGRD